MIDQRWVDGIRKAWKGVLSRALRNPDPPALNQVLSFLEDLEEDLLINKGMWVYPYFFEETPFLKMRQKMMQDLASIERLKTDLEMATRPRNVGRIDPSESLKEIDQILSRKILSALTREIKRQEDKVIDLKKSAPSIVDVGNVKVIFGDGGGKNPIIIEHVLEHIYQSPIMAPDPRLREKFLAEVRKAQALLRRKKLGHLWYGEIYVSPALQGRSPSQGYASYESGRDRIRFEGYRAVKAGDGAYTIIHELGHRQWFKFMSSRQRAAFSAYYDTGEVEPVTGYGGTMPSEDFAEVFAHYVTGKHLTRDQKERFEAFFGGQIVASIQERSVSSAMAILRVLS
jgi:hypothetical protein